jgi:hypothetical protein
MEKRMDLLQSFVRYHSHCFYITSPPPIKMTPPSSSAIAILLKSSKLKTIIARTESGGYDTLNSTSRHYCKSGRRRSILKNRDGMRSNSCCYFAFDTSLTQLRF